MTQFCLASRSPRRQALLAQLGLEFCVEPADIDEQAIVGSTPADYAVAVALAKARAVAARIAPALPVLGADTDVVVDGEILGKPRDAEDGLSMLARLSDRTHEVYSGVALVAGDRAATAMTLTRVRFGVVTEAQARAYWDSGEPLDKAGAYAIQGGAAAFVKSIEGSYSGVVGLPLYETCHLLREFGIEAAHVPRRQAA